LLDARELRLGFREWCEVLEAICGRNNIETVYISADLRNLIVLSEIFFPNQAPAKFGIRRLMLRVQVNGIDVRAMRAPMNTKLDFSRKEIGAKGAAGAVAAMLLWSLPTLTCLDLRCSPHRPEYTANALFCLFVYCYSSDV
jgi:hypothetical protein